MLILLAYLLRSRPNSFRLQHNMLFVKALETVHCFLFSVLWTYHLFTNRRGISTPFLCWKVPVFFSNDTILKLDEVVLLQIIKLISGLFLNRLIADLYINCPTPVKNQILSTKSDCMATKQINAAKSVKTINL